MDKIADRKLSNFSNEITKFDFSKQVESLNEVLNENKGKPLTPEILDSIHAKLTDGLDFVTSTSVRKDLDEMFPSFGKYNFDEDSLKNVRKVLEEQIASVPLSKEELGRIIPDEESILNGFKDRGLLRMMLKIFLNIQNLFKICLTKELINLHKQILRI